MPKLSAAEVEAIVRQVAAEEGVDPDLAAAIVQQESGFDATAVGDGGRSYGAWQEHEAGRGYGLSAAQRMDPVASTRRAAREIRATIEANPRADPGTVAVL